MVKQIVIRILGLALIIIALNFIYNFTLYDKDLYNECEEVLEMKKKKKETDILYFAESSNFNVQDKDSTKLCISEMTNLFFPKLKIIAVNKPAAHAGLYRYWLTQIDPSYKPKAVIVTLNMRSFDAPWIHSKLETPLQECIMLIKPYPNLVNRFLLSLNAYDNKTEAEREKMLQNEWEWTEIKFPFPFKYNTVRAWDNNMGWGGYKHPDGSWDFPKIGLACHYIKAFAFNINDENPRVKDFDFIADWCAKNKINLYLNLMAENIQYADSLVGKELVFLMKENRDYLVKRYNKNNCVVIDNLEAVPGKEYSDQVWTNEHYSYKGRMTVSKNVANKLKDQFNNYYIKAY